MVHKTLKDANSSERLEKRKTYEHAAGRQAEHADTAGVPEHEERMVAAAAGLAQEGAHHLEGAAARGPRQTLLRQVLDAMQQRGHRLGQASSSARPPPQ